ISVDTFGLEDFVIVCDRISNFSCISVLLIGGLLHFELLFKCCFCFRCVLLSSFKA
ncbi:hypothetical protein LINPERHAP1_LOCUS236, partial [Linum perenne]